MRTRVDFLLRQGVETAVWFCECQYMETNLDSVIYALEKGFTIGNHASSHSAFSQLSIAEACAEIEQTEELIRTAHSQAGREDCPLYFRFPYGDKGDGGRPAEVLPDPQLAAHRKAIQVFLKERGYKPPPWDYQLVDSSYHQPGDVDWLWTFESKDWRCRVNENNTHRAPETLERYRREFLRPLSSSLPEQVQVLLIHDHDFGETRLFEETITSVTNGRWVGPHDLLCESV